MPTKQQKKFQKIGGWARRVETEWGKESIATFILEMGLELLIPVAGPFAIVSLRL